jgi:hypothetical protein
MLVLDRVPYVDGVEEVVMTQRVPARMGGASYPLWALSREKVYATLSQHYTPLMEFASTDHPLHASHIRAAYRGSIWLRRE